MNVEQILSMLPQGKVIKPHHAEKWLKTMLSRDDFHNIEWHVSRLKGIGGSESIVGLQRWYMEKGEKLADPFADPRSLVMQKLMMYVPSEASPKMLRGNRFEDLIVERFCEQYNAKVRQDLMDAVAEQSGKDPEHPWLVGNPDLIVEGADGRIYLVDIKAPDEAHEEFPFRYVVQLHHYREIMKRAGVLPHGMILGNFSWKDYAVKALEVPYDPNVAEGLIKGGDLLWDDVMNGRVPELITFEEKKTPVPDDAVSALAEEEEKYLRWKLVADEVNKKVEEHAARIKEIASPYAHEIDKSHGLAKGLDLLTLQVRKKPDAEQIKTLLKQRGLEDKFEEITKPTASYDVEAMKAALEAAGIDPEQFKKRTVDTDKAVRLFNEEGVSTEVLARAGVIEFTPMPVFRAPKRGPRVEKFTEIMTQVDPIVRSLEEQVELGEAETGFAIQANTDTDTSFVPDEPEIKPHFPKPKEDEPKPQQSQTAAHSFF